MQQPRVASTRDTSKINTIAAVATRVQELRVIESIEELSPEFNTGVLGNASVFVQSDVPIVDPRSATNGSRSITDAPNSLRS